MNESNPDDNSTSFGYEASQFLRIPLRRIGAVIGVGGSNREAIEEATETTIVIDSDTGEVEVRPGEDLKDPVQLFNARDIVKAIGRGFSLDIAMKLTDDDNYLDVIRLKPLVGNKSNQLRRVRGRVIGKNGITRKSIEDLTGVSLVVSGSTVSVIGTYEQIDAASEAIISIIKGAKIESVIGKLESARSKMQKEEQKLWKDEKDTPPEDLNPEEEEEEDVFADFKED